MLPMPIDIGEPGGADPRWWLLRTLALTVGLPFFALSATAPLLQQWFSQTNDPKAKDPYFSTPRATPEACWACWDICSSNRSPREALRCAAGRWRSGPSRALMAACAYASACARGRSRASAAKHARGTPEPEPDSGSRSRRVLWVALALVPSALLLGVTQHLATDVVSAPLLWVLPLALYWSTFIAAFSTRGFGSARHWGRLRRWWRSARPGALACGGALSDPADHAGASRRVHGAGDAVPHAPRRKPPGPCAPHRVFRVRLARRCAGRRGRGASWRRSCSRQFSSIPSRSPRRCSSVRRAFRRIAWRNRPRHAGRGAPPRRCCSSPDTGACRAFNEQRERRRAASRRSCST